MWQSFPHIALSVSSFQATLLFSLAMFALTCFMHNLKFWINKQVIKWHNILKKVITHGLMKQYFPSLKWEHISLHLGHMTWQEEQIKCYLSEKECSVRAIVKRETIVRWEKPALITQHHSMETQTICHWVLSKIIKSDFYFAYNYSGKLASVSSILSVPHMSFFCVLILCLYSILCLSLSLLYYFTS